MSEVIDRNDLLGIQREAYEQGLRDGRTTLTWRNEPPSEEEFDCGRARWAYRIGHHEALLIGPSHGQELAEEHIDIEFAGPIIIHEQETD